MHGIVQSMMKPLPAHRVPTRSLTICFMAWSQVKVEGLFYRTKAVGKKQVLLATSMEGCDVFKIEYKILIIWYWKNGCHIDSVIMKQHYMLLQLNEDECVCPCQLHQYMYRCRCHTCNPLLYRQKVSQTKPFMDWPLSNFSQFYFCKWVPLHMQVSVLQAKTFTDGL